MQARYLQYIHGKPLIDNFSICMMRTIWSRLIYGAFYAMLYDKVWRHRMSNVATSLPAQCSLFLFCDQRELSTDGDKPGALDVMAPRREL